MTKRPQKRRRLSASSSTTSGTDSGPWYAPPLSPPTYDGPGPAEGGPSKAASCISCHRPLSVGTVDGKEGLIVLCPRCHEMSCSICSRICTTCPPSMPPTPLLSYTPTPPATPTLPCSPLPSDADDTPKARAHAHAFSVASDHTRRRKKREDDEEQTLIGGDDDYGKSPGEQSAGCGRTFCKNCCIESTQNGTTTCYDCYGLPPPSLYAGPSER